MNNEFDISFLKVHTDTSKRIERRVSVVTTMIKDLWDKNYGFEYDSYSFDFENEKVIASLVYRPGCSCCSPEYKDMEFPMSYLESEDDVIMISELDKLNTKNKLEFEERQKLEQTTKQQTEESELYYYEYLRKKFTDKK